jgi:hypothetical protein
MSLVINAWISGQPWWMVAFTTGLAPVSARRLPRDKLAAADQGGRAGQLESL